MIGAERLERKYDRKDALCCGGALMARGKPPAELQERNLRDALESGMRELVCLCPICIDMLKPRAQALNLKLTHIIELTNRSLPG